MHRTPPASRASSRLAFILHPSSFILCLLLLVLSLGAGYRQPTPVQESALLCSQTAQIILVDGANTYVATSDQPGAAATAAVWQIKKIAVSGGTTIITWADGNNAFDNIPGTAGAGLAALSYQ